MLTDIKRSSLVDQVIERLLAQLQAGNWPLGYKLPPENTLASELGVGRSTVREAVRVLAHNGFLEVRQGAGTFVIAVQPASESLLSQPVANDQTLQVRLRRAKILDVYEVRRAIELEAARLAATRRDEDDLARIDAALARREKARQFALNEDYIKADLDFHVAVADAAHNPVLSELFGTFAEVLHEALALLVADAPSRIDARNAHFELAQAIRDKDSAAAERATLEHINATIEKLGQLLAKQ
jgi:DNA-binding FadR family transcriptional regulator